MTIHTRSTILCKRVVYYRLWPADWNIHLPASDRWNLLCTFAKWTGGPLREVSWAIAITYVPPAWQGIPTFHLKRHVISEWAIFWPMDGQWRPVELVTALTKSLAGEFPCVRLHEKRIKSMVDTTGELLPEIFDAARRVHDVYDVSALRNVTHSIVERVEMCIQANGGYFKDSLNWILQSFRINK
jgi:hypothetical protein